MKYYAAFAMSLATSSVLADQPIEITFAADLGGQPFSCVATYDGLGTGTATVQVLDYRMFVSGASVITLDGKTVPIALEQDGVWQVDDIALLDFENGSGSCTNGTADTNFTLRGTIPEGDYDGIQFTVGVPFDWNHSDPTVAPSPLNLTAMFWNWRAGYKFLKFETSPIASSAMKNGPEQDAHVDASGWFLHLGSTMCAAASRTEAPEATCTNPNTMRVTFDSFDADSNIVVIDPASVIAGVDLTANAPETSPG